MKIALIVLAVVVALVAAFVRPPTAPVASAGFVAAAPSGAGQRPREARATPGAAIVYVAGEVVHPGVVRLTSSARAVDALAAVGGARPDADLVAVNLAAPVRDGDEIVVPARGSATFTAASSRRSSHVARTPSTRSRHARQPRAAAARALPAEPVDVNHADATTLATLPGIGPALAQRIVAYRDAFGPFAAPDDLLDVAGITERRLSALTGAIVVR